MCHIGQSLRWGAGTRQRRNKKKTVGLGGRVLMREGCWEHSQWLCADARASSSGHVSGARTGARCVRLLRGPICDLFSDLEASMKLLLKRSQGLVRPLYGAKHQCHRRLQKVVKVLQTMRKRDVEMTACSEALSKYSESVVVSMMPAHEELVKLERERPHMTHISRCRGA